jgi:hypothetical protein
MVRVEGSRENIYPAVEALGMWESRRDFQRVWEGWEAGFMAFHAFHTLSFPGPAFRAEGVGETDVPPPSAICRTRREMCIGTSSLVIECIGDSLTHRDYEPGYPPVRVAGFTATWNSVTSEVAGSSPSPRRIFQMIYGMIWQRTIRKAGSKLHPVCSQN